MKKGVNAWCFPDQTEVNDLFQSAAKLGFDGVELNLSEEQNAVLSFTAMKEELDQVVRAADQHSLALPSISTDLLWKYPLTDNDEAVRQKGAEFVEKMIETADIVGAGTVLVVPGLVNPLVSYDKAYTRSLEVLKYLAEKAEQKNIRIGIENVWNKFLLSPLEMASFIDEINSSHVGAYLDIGNVLQFGYPEHWIRILSERIFAVHVKDFKELVGNIQGFVPLLSGDISWNTVKQALKDINYDGYVIPEIPAHGEHPDWLLQSISQTLNLIFGFEDRQGAADGT
jgi:L-ribulose-5-phosphate 3-epimerase